MTQDEPELYDLSRRKVLGGLTAVGVASVGAGLGTSAYFSDVETFTNNSLVAGALDLKVDWEEHYHLTNEQVNIGTENEPEDGVLLSDPGPDSDFVGFPNPAEPMVWVHPDAIDEYMDMTSLEAYPDANNDGIQDDLTEYLACADFADTPEDLNPEGGKALRTNNEDTAIFEDDSLVGYHPLVNLNDVKPGDFGELTLSFHLCDNPGYIWFQGEPVAASEGGHTEPESKDDDEVGSPDEQVTGADVLTSDVELLDAVQTMLWYDEDGDNVYEPGGVTGEVDVVIVLDESGSMATGTKMEQAKQGAIDLINALSLGPNAAQVGVVSFDENAVLRQGLTDSNATAVAGVNAISNNPTGSTNMETGVEAGHEELTGADISGEIAASGNDRSGADKIMVFLGDGEPNVNDPSDGGDSPSEEAAAARTAGIEIYTIGYGVSAGSTAATVLEDMASTPQDEYFYLAATDEIEQVFGQISQVIAGEKSFFEGTLRELLGVLSTDMGIPLDGNRVTAFDEFDDAANAESRECFVDSTTNALGLAWWLPVDHANEIQTDAVSFDLGFYTEQCRHNDGAGNVQVA